LLMKILSLARAFGRWLFRSWMALALLMFVMT
jgi:hypothetical protein